MSDDEVGLTSSAAFLGRRVTVRVDRPLGSKHPKHGFLYEANYGYVPGTTSADGEELDAYVLGVSEPIETFEGDCIAVIQRFEEDDDKLVVVPFGTRLSEEEISSMTHFQERYFSSRIVWPD